MDKRTLKVLEISRLDLSDCQFFQPFEVVADGIGIINLRNVMQLADHKSADQKQAPQQNSQCVVFVDNDNRQR